MTEVLSLSPYLSQGYSLIFYSTLFWFVIFSLIIVYHWKQYSPSPKISTRALAIYFSIGLPLLAGFIIAFIVLN